LVAFMICITLNDVCICSLLLMKKAVSMYWIRYLCQVWALSLIQAPQPKQKSFANRSYHQSVHWQCVKRKDCLQFHTPVSDRVAIFWYMVLINISKKLNKLIYFTCQSHILYKILLNNLVCHLWITYTVWTYYT
jgi:hypothetical protein